MSAIARYRQTRPFLKLKTLPKQLLGYLPLASHSLAHPVHWSERDKEREGERERERGRERERELLFLFLKGMTGASTPCSYLVIKY